MISIDYTLIIVILNFIVLLIILNKLLYRPINKFLNERKQKIEENIDEAAKMRKDASSLVKKQEEEMKKTAEEIRTLKKQAKKEAESQADNIIHQAKDQEKKIKQETERQLYHEREKVVGEIQVELASMVAGLTEKIVAGKLDDSKDKKLIESLLKDGK